MMAQAPNDGLPNGCAVQPVSSNAVIVRLMNVSTTLTLAEARALQAALSRAIAAAPTASHLRHHAQLAQAVVSGAADVGNLGVSGSANVGTEPAKS
jgi:hypothetical protein